MTSRAHILRPALAALAAMLVALLVPGAAAEAATAACSGRSSGGMVTRLRTFTVEGQPTNKSYKVGTTAVVKVTVTRPGQEDPLGNGIPLNSPVSFPAEDVDVFVGLYLGNFYMYGVGVTDEEGKATIRVKLNPNAPAGNVIGEIGAREFYNRGGCPDIEEEGFVYYPRFFKATK